MFSYAASLATATMGAAAVAAGAVVMEPAGTALEPASGEALGSAAAVAAAAEWV